LFLEHLTKGSCVDIGSGAGFPGLVLALARPELDMTLLEPKRKRASFLRVALAELQRADVKVVEARLEDLAGAFDLVISRATIPPLDLIPLSVSKLAPGGRMIITSGAGAPSVEAIVEAALRAGLRHRVRTERVLPTGQKRILDVVER
jgi:16S rRNA (guanine527-N7)-methyltransferase